MDTGSTKLSKRIDKKEGISIKLFLRPIGGFGARMIPLLQTMIAVRESSHSLVVCWPQASSRSRGGPTGPHREQVFELGVNELYSFESPFTDMSEPAYMAKTEQHSHYPLRHTQNMNGNGQAPVHCAAHAHESFCVDAHGPYLLNGERACSASLGEAYREHFKLHPPQREMCEDLRSRFKGRRTVGVYFRQSRGANYQVLSWNATQKILPKMREHAQEDPSTLFFVISDQKSILDDVIREFGEDNVVTTPKPNIVNHPDEMLGVTVDIELMRTVDVYYPTWGSWLGKLMGLVRLGDGKQDPLAWGFGMEAEGQSLRTSDD